MLASAGFYLFANPRAACTAPYGKDGREAILSLAAFGDAKREIMSWPGYKPTPLRSLPKLAARAGIGAILYKDEAERFGIGSFKALGGAYAVFKLLRKTIWEQKNVIASTLDLTSGRYSDLTSRVTVTCDRRQSWAFGCLGRPHLRLSVRDLYPGDSQRRPLPSNRRLWCRSQARGRDL